MNTETPDTTTSDTTTDTITVSVDGTPRTLVQGTSVRALVAELLGQEITAEGTAASGKRLGVAVAVDGRVVPRGKWDGHVLAAGSAIEVVTAAQGG
ncbi:sulfur carrier protein ThiS [Brevibacterium sp. 91QC2O2]|uniref:sulfur carrier protein ThiS n=1 Tax=Brevibacterium TaxID=1696 RepID=UPI00211C80BA|nr:MULTISPECIES: sulfur carrier protein ThiS [unclassified Brevibacterium]MCQ9367256.1 sulfur carrier protein ThiS [Brevibacterium sp. 91QC2O2]MCQ9386739.1 sulfur carrier protein ThiS [Brevibacterium sp. 68QC2CO]